MVDDYDDEEALSVNAELDVEQDRMRWPEGPLKDSWFAAHTFQGRLDRDCEICGAPDRNPVHIGPQGTD